MKSNRARLLLCLVRSRAAVAGVGGFTRRRGGDRESAEHLLGGFSQRARRTQRNNEKESHPLQVVLLRAPPWFNQTATAPRLRASA